MLPLPPPQPQLSHSPSATFHRMGNVSLRIPLQALKPRPSGGGIGHIGPTVCAQNIPCQTLNACKLSDNPWHKCCKRFKSERMTQGTTNASPFQPPLARSVLSGPVVGASLIKSQPSRPLGLQHAQAAYASHEQLPPPSQTETALRRSRAPDALMVNIRHSQ